MLLLLELVEAQLLEGLGKCWCGLLSVADFLIIVSHELSRSSLDVSMYLYVANHVVLDRLECCRAQDICDN